MDISKETIRCNSATLGRGFCLPNMPIISNYTIYLMRMIMDDYIMSIVDQ